MNVYILVVDDEPDVEALFRQQFRRDLRAGPAGHFKFLRVWSVKFLHPRGRTRDC
ncbi:hypothetical protein M2229_001554 [Bradyrhizobium japonicum]|nr:hypothetical protein [Bradyrhizobium japonicum]